MNVETVLAGRLSPVSPNSVTVGPAVSQNPSGQWLIAGSALTWAVSFGIGFGTKRHEFRHLCNESVMPANRRKSMPWTTRPSHFSCAAMATAHARGVCWEANGQLGGRNRSSWETSFH